MNFNINDFKNIVVANVKRVDGVGGILENIATDIEKELLNIQDDGYDVDGIVVSTDSANIYSVVLNTTVSDKLPTEIRKLYNLNNSLYAIAKTKDIELTPYIIEAVVAGDCGGDPVNIASGEASGNINNASNVENGSKKKQLNKILSRN